ncbi:UBC-like protein [Thelephora ganbajun]|uniref:UBC-like protein n=1 Tax=Thelephora ganbajun TaxID=370292 RepID=A0ACB6ZSW0_THEGA|nr:UBC-like protein [Thelephora ganbajun]
MYGYTTYNEPPSTPPRLSRSLTAQTPTRSQPGSALPPSTPATTRSTMTMAQAEEYASLRYPGHCPLGMYLIPDKNNIFVWDGVFFVHQGYYSDCILKFRLLFPKDYPNSAPQVQFLTDVFHPLISQKDGSFNLSRRFRPWRPKEHHVYDVLHWVKASFKKQALDEIKDHDCFNKEAFRLYHESTSSFAALATQSSMLSQSASALFDKDHPSMAGKGTHGIAFKELKPDQLDAIRKKIGLRDWDDES